MGVCLLVGRGGMLAGGVCMGKGDERVRRGGVGALRKGGGRERQTFWMAESRVGLGPVCLAPKRRFMVGD